MPRFLIGFLVAIAFSTSGRSSGGEPDAVVGRDVEIHGQAGTIRGFLAMPEGAGPFPAIVVVPDWWGLTDWAKENARDLARKGYVALAVDLYGGKITEDPLVAYKLARELDHARAVADLEAGVSYLKGLKCVRNDKPVGAIGWSLGGQLACELAESSPFIGPVAICYGGVPTEPARVAKLKGKPLLLILGGDDRGLPVARVEPIAKALEALPSPVLVRVYPGAAHGFMRPDPTTAKLKLYNASADKEARAEIAAFFKKHL